MKNAKSYKGFTLIEIMVSVVLASIILVTLYSLFTSQQKTYNSQDLIVEMQQNVRTALDTMVRDLRTMGYGIPTVSNPSAIEAITSATENSITFKVDMDDVSASLVSDYTAPGTTLSVNTVSDSSSSYYYGRFSAGDTIYITDGYKWNSTMISASAVGSLTITPLTDYFPAGSVLHVIHSITFSQSPSNHLHSTSTSTNKITRSIDGGSAQPVVDDIDYLEFKYYDENDNLLGSVTPYKGVALSSSEKNSVRKIKVLVIARTMREDPYYKDSGTYNCGDTYSDRYHRITLESDIKLRNIGSD
ncbi:MAG: prepilin-type N-terminal cleavage/methylation domain-containing protein [Candidatus Schekmanbacteria bacterium]|nr:prepilin-type N-terminal cleavage/methylation domain-containing protein [Candidatus Schekmanbacteria bacterium]